MKRFLKVVSLLVVGALIGFGIGWAWPILNRLPLLVGQDAVVVSADEAEVSVVNASGKVLVIEPADVDARVALILYPGGLVRPQAYEWLGHALATRGVRTLIPEMPLDLAVLGKDRATQVADDLAGDLPVVIGGHSLGGAMAASYAAENPEALAGLVLLAAYPPDGDDLSGTTVPVLSLYGEHDEVADLDTVLGAADSLPSSARFVEVTGSVHSFFGRYGPQSGDGVPTVSRADAEAAIADAVGDFLDGIGI